MSSRARLVPDGVLVHAFDWGGTHAGGGGHLAATLPLPVLPEVLPEPVIPVPAIDVADLERAAFGRGYAEGESAGLAAAAARTETVLRQVAACIDELRGLRASVLQRTERQVVLLALAIARRIVRREASLDPELVATMARVALERLAPPAAATIRLHPDDYAAMTYGRRATDAGPQVVADPQVPRGGCVVQSDLGIIDVSVDAQIEEVGKALLGDGADGALATTEAVRVR